MSSRLFRFISEKKYWAQVRSDKWLVDTFSCFSWTNYEKLWVFVLLLWFFNKNQKNKNFNLRRLRVINHQQISSHRLIFLQDLKAKTMFSCCLIFLKPLILVLFVGKVCKKIQNFNFLKKMLKYWIIWKICRWFRPLWSWNSSRNPKTWKSRIWPNRQNRWS